MGLWKRRRGRVEYLTPAQMLETLALLRMRALVAHGAVWVAADRGCAAALDQCCVGALEGGPGTARWVAGLVGATRSTPDALAGGGGGGEGQPNAAAPEDGAADGNNNNPPKPNPNPLLAGAAEGGGVSAARLRAVRLAPEEAMFLAHVLAPSLAAFELVEGRSPEAARPMSRDELWRWCCRSGGGGSGGGGGGGSGGGGVAAPPPAALDAANANASDPLLAATIGREGRGEGQAQAPTRPCPFEHRYAAYCHLRAKGWLPRGGLLYGADFVLYGLHPALVHSEYVAVVLPLERRGGPPEGEGEEGRGEATAPRQANGAASAAPTAARARGWWAEGPPAALRWVDAQIAQRLARQVFKQLLLVHVALPSGVGGSSPQLGPDDVLARGAVRETVARRWVPPAGGGVAQALAESSIAAGGLEPADDD